MLSPVKQLSDYFDMVMQQIHSLNACDEVIICLPTISYGTGPVASCRPILGKQDNSTDKLTPSLLLP